MSAPRRLPPAALRPVAHLVGRVVLDAELPFDRQRARQRRLLGAGRLPADVTSTPTELGGISGLVVSPAGADATRGVLLLHGGGYCIGDAAGYAAFAGAIAAACGTRVWVPDYRLAPEHPHPAALEDAATAFKEVTTGLAPERIVVVGDSAGAGLAVALAARLRDAGEDGPAALGLISPWLDLGADRRADTALARRDPMLGAAWLERCAAAYAGGRALDDPGLSPLHGQLAGLPPSYVIAGADDLLVGDADRFVTGARAGGVEVDYTRVPRLWHDFPLHAGMLGAADTVLAQLAAFMSRHVGPAGA